MPEITAATPRHRGRTHPEFMGISEAEKWQKKGDGPRANLPVNTAEDDTPRAASGSTYSVAGPAASAAGIAPAVSECPRARDHSERPCQAPVASPAWPSQLPPAPAEPRPARDEPGRTWEPT